MYRYAFRSPCALAFFILLSQCASTSKLAASTGISQSGFAGKTSEIKFQVASAPSNSPVRITQIYLGDKIIDLNAATFVSGAWLGKLRVLVQNISPQEIIAGTVVVSFPETGDGSGDHPILTSGANLGRVPSVAFRHRDGTVGPIPEAFTKGIEVHFPPGSTMEFDIGFAQGEVDQQQVYSQVSEISKVTIRTGAFYFANGTKWTGDSYYVPVPPPVLWKPLKPEDFFNNQ